MKSANTKYSCPRTAEIQIGHNFVLKGHFDITNIKHVYLAIFHYNFSDSIGLWFDTIVSNYMAVKFISKCTFRLCI